MKHENLQDYTHELIDYMGIDKTPNEYYKETKNVFYFTFIWNLFENHCCKRNANFKCFRDLIENYSNISNVSSLSAYYDYFKNAIVLGEEDSFNFNGRLSTFKFINKINQDGSIEFNRGCKDAWLLVKKALGDETVPNKEKVEALLCITYRIRNNLFHGEKDPRKIKYQDKTFRLANKFLLDITKIVKPNFDDPSY